MQKKISLIENDPDVRDLITYILEDDGMTVMQLTATEDLEAIAKSEPELILIDEWISGEPGHRLCLRIRQVPHLSHIAVIIMSTAHNIKQIMTECRANGYIRKPFDLTDLLESVHQQVGR